MSTEPYWWEAAPPWRGPEADLPQAADVLVVGGGYAGLSAALELAVAGVRVAVIEAGTFGIGASTRNGGMVSGVGSLGRSKDLAATYGASGARKLMDAAEDSYEFLQTIMDREGIRCFHERSGRFIGAHSPDAYRRLEARAKLLNEFSAEQAEMLPRSRQDEEIASSYYFGGMLLHNAGALHPSLLHRGLLDAVLRAGGLLVANCELEHLETGSSSILARTNRGRIAAKEVVVATNGYTGNATPELRRKLIPVTSFMIATEAIGESSVRALLPNLKAVADTKRVLYYFRPSHDRTRLLFGGRAKLTGADPRASAPILRKFMIGVFPQLKGVSITHAWCGNVAFAFDRLPHAGTRGRVHYCLGCNGNGVAMMTYLGSQVARTIMGKGERRSAFAEIPFRGRPLYSGDPWFLPLVGSYFRMRDWIDRRWLGVF